MRLAVGIVSVGLLLGGCTPEQKLARLLKRHPELIKSDTTYRTDTIIVKGGSKDTVFFNTISKDTIVIKENNMTIKYLNRGDSIFIHGDCDTIKLIREVPFITNSVSYVEKQTKWYDWLIRILGLLSLGGLLALMFVLIRVKK